MFVILGSKVKVPRSITAITLEHIQCFTSAYSNCPLPPTHTQTSKKSLSLSLSLSLHLPASLFVCLCLSVYLSVSVFPLLKHRIETTPYRCFRAWDFMVFHPDKDLISSRCAPNNWTTCLFFFYFKMPLNLYLRSTLIRYVTAPNLPRAGSRLLLSTLHLHCGPIN